MSHFESLELSPVLVESRKWRVLFPASTKSPLAYRQGKGHESFLEGLDLLQPPRFFQLCVGALGGAPALFSPRKTGASENAKLGLRGVKIELRRASRRALKTSGCLRRDWQPDSDGEGTDTERGPVGG